jgi:hypothetical protein
MINQVEEVEPNELIDLLQNESIEMICCPEVPDTPSAMKTDIKTASSKDDNSVHSSTKFLLIASKSDDFEVNVANAASPSPQFYLRKRVFTTDQAFLTVYMSTTQENLFLHAH